MTGLPEPVRQLLEAVVEAVDLPLADVTVHDDRERTILMDRRMLHVAIVIGSIAHHADSMTIEDLAQDTRLLRKYTADTPVAYRTFADRQQDGGTS
jgi:hypothetical protein